jgi:glycerol-3-phosphate dehydrogenase (NAD(P)+)
MGTALANAAATGARPSVLWSDDETVSTGVNTAHRHPYHFVHHRLPRSLVATTSLREALSGAGCVIVTVPSEEARALAKNMQPYLESDAVVVSTMKSLEHGTNKRMSVVLQEETNVRDVGAISGPNLSHDILESRPTGLVVGAERRGVVKCIAEALEGPALRVFGTLDLVGLELMGALKNVIAIGAGIVAGLALGDNARALIIARGLTEIQMLSMSLGGCRETSLGLGGIGDLFLTATSVHSRNHMVGVELGRGIRLPQIIKHLGQLRETAEGIKTVEACHHLAVSQQLNMPLAESVYAIMFGERDPRTTILSVLNDASDGFHGCPLPKRAGRDV